MPSPSTRLDLEMVRRGLMPSRTQAQAAIAQGHVTVNGAPCRKPGVKVAECDRIDVASDGLIPYVGRGGIKLAAALDAFGIDPADRLCLDVGASTGGFTDCLLQRGAAHVTAIDVGSGQMAARLSNDPRVTLRENINARYIAETDIAGQFDLIVVDVSFISLTLLLRPLAPLLARPSGAMIALIKPQFEVGAGGLGPGGIVRDDKRRKGAVESVCAAAIHAGLTRHGLIESPITGGDGNIEYLAWFSKGPSVSATPIHLPDNREGKVDSGMR